MTRFGNQSKKIARWLRELSDLDRNAPSRGATVDRINALRELIPTSMLRHYDHLKSRGKRSVAPVTHGVCGSCHLGFPSGILANLRRTSEMLNICINCGAFVYLAEEESANGSIKAGVSRQKKQKVQSKRAVVRGRARTRSRKVRAAR